MSNQVILALTGCPRRPRREAPAAARVQERLAACVHRVGELRSTYIWDARLQDAAGILLIMPEVLAIAVADGNERYLDWVRMGVRNKGER